MKPSFTIPGKSQSIGSLSEPEFLGHFRPYTYQSTILYINQHNLNPNSPYVGLCRNGQQRKSQKFPTIRSHVLGPIKRPLTASNQPKHRKTLKNGNKTQVGRKSNLLELSKTRKPGVHALSSPRRTASLLAPSTADGRICRKSRKKSETLSLESEFGAHCIHSPIHVFLAHLKLGKTAMCTILSLVT